MLTAVGERVLALEEAAVPNGPSVRAALAIMRSVGHRAAPMRSATPRRS